jgi:hypothetical protein
MKTEVWGTRCGVWTRQDRLTLTIDSTLRGIVGASRNAVNEWNVGHAAVNS